MRLDHGRDRTIRAVRHGDDAEHEHAPRHDRHHATRSRIRLQDAGSGYRGDRPDEERGHEPAELAMINRLTDRRRGVTLVELLVSLVIMAIIGTALTRLTMSQARFFSQFAAKRGARSATRGAMGMMLADLRMVDPTSGIELAS